MKKKKKGLIILAAIVAVVVVVVLVIPKNTVPVAMNISMEALAKTDIRSTISATGTVESNTSKNVYSKLSGTQVKTLNVEVGDKVTEGEILALFDTQTIEDQIAQQKASMSDSAAKSQLSVEQSRKQYNQQVTDFQNDQNASLLTAQKNVSNASDALRDATYAVEHFGEDATSLTADELDAAGQAMKDRNYYSHSLRSYLLSQKQVEEAKEDLEAAKKTGNSNEITSAQNGLDAEQKELDRSKHDFELAKESYPQVDYQYGQKKTAEKQAQENLDLVMKQYEITFNNTLTSIDSAADSVTGSKLNASQKVAQLNLQTMEKQLLDATVTAPVSGTITAVYAKEGAAATGLMFVIENTDSLKIKTTVKEFDLASVKVGQKVEIKSDATGEAVMEGSVISIAPTAVKNAEGSTKSGTVEFETEISVDGSHDGLRIGMNARVNIITAEQKNVYAVPFDAVLADQSGSFIYTAVPGEKDLYTAKKVTVTPGLETDFYLEIQGADLTDGMIVITNPTGITEGSPIPATAIPAATAAGV